jgi:hypothetical protein
VQSTKFKNKVFKFRPFLFSTREELPLLDEKEVGGGGEEAGGLTYGADSLEHRRVFFFLAGDRTKISRGFTAYRIVAIS